MRNNKSKREDIYVYAARLNLNLPKSEVWFQGIWKSRYEDENDKYNYPLKGRIPDLVNTVYKYVIEVDGAVHNSKKQRVIDRRKDQYYKNLGYEVFRVVAYDEIQATEAGECVERLRRSKYQPKSTTAPKILIRKNRNGLTETKAV